MRRPDVVDVGLRCCEAMCLSTMEKRFLGLGFYSRSNGAKLLVVGSRRKRRKLLVDFNTCEEGLRELGLS